MNFRDDHSLLPPGTRTFSRRDLFGLLARGAGAAVALPSVLDLVCRRALAQDAAPLANHKKLILLWLEGGPSQIDTFDPKPGSPNNGPFKALATDVKGWRFGEYLPQLAKRAEKLSIIRTMTSKEGSHARARELLHCGYVPNPAVPYPVLGAMVAHELGDLGHDLPAFVQVDGPVVGRSGYLGIESAPFFVGDPTGKIENLSYTSGVDKARMDEREAIRGQLDAQFGDHGGGRAVHANDAQRKRARRLMDSALLSAFDLTQEPDAVRDRYGKTRFGAGALLARRLLEHGVQTVEVVLDGWDTHFDNFNITSRLCQQLDPAYAALLDDLEERGMMKDTLVLCMGEFGRTPFISPSNNGRNHWPNNYCALLAGAGIKPGVVVGETDERGESIVSRPVQVPDLFATIATTLGIDGTKLFHTGKRPVTLVDRNGEPVQELLA